MKLYHYTKKENVLNVLEKGLKASSNYENLNSYLRLNTVYAWLLPEHDVMGFMNNDDYELLELEVDETRCLVVNMDYISTAYVNKQLGDKSGMDLSITMTKLYEDSAIRPTNYNSGYFRTPEVLVKGNILPSQINVVKKLSGVNRNKYDYTERLKEHILFRNERFTIEKLDEWNMRLIAVHDDSTGILATIKDISRDEYVTVVLNEETSEVFIKLFFNKKRS